MDTLIAALLLTDDSCNVPEQLMAIAQEFVECMNRLQSAKEEHECAKEHYERIAKEFEGELRVFSARRGHRLLHVGETSD